MEPISWTYGGLEVVVPARTGNRRLASAAAAILAMLSSVLLTSWILVQWWPASLLVLAVATAGFWGVVALTAADETP